MAPTAAETLLLTLDTLEQLERWIIIRDDLDATQLANAFTAMGHKVQFLGRLPICGLANQQVAVLRRLIGIRKELSLMGSWLDATVGKRVKTLAKLSEPQGLGGAVSAIKSKRTRVCVPRLFVNGIQYNHVTFCQDLYKITSLDDSIAITSNLVHSIQKPDDQSVLLGLYWDDSLWMEVFDPSDGQVLVRALEAFSG
ncbi:MAG: hypothetical protein Q9191_007339 [Dirinaria sp. TL-2023a]